jgi:2-dehydro-3-deoxyphosphooctonate aldolase (KDO 8-P synthase)
MAERIKRVTEELNLPFIFKASYLKANRSSISSYVGPGLKKGLKILSLVKEKFNVPIISDIHSIEQIEPAAEVLDIIQIPAFLCRQTELVINSAKTGKVINVKKGQFLAPEDIKNVLDKIYSTGNKKVLITERGSSFGYHNLVVDYRSLEIIKSLGAPVVFDATHSVQLPGAGGNKSGGQRQFVYPLSKAAVAVGINAIFLEVHDNPNLAKSDGSNMMPLRDLQKSMSFIMKLDNLVKESLNEN